MRATGSVLAVALLLAAAPACGTPDSTFPPDAECLALPPLPTSRAVAGVTSPQAYVEQARLTTSQLLQIRNRFVSTYPNDTFYRRDSFRPDMARFADDTICTALQLRGIASPVAGLDAWAARLHSALDELIAHTRFGREAVRSRNVSEYRQYRAGLEERLRAVELIAFTSP